MITSSISHPLIKPKCRYKQLRSSFSEEVFNLENIIRTKPNRETFAQLLNLYVEGIENYSIKNNTQLYIDYTTKLNSLIIISATNNQSNRTNSPSKSPLKISKISLEQTSKKLMTQFTISLSAFVDAVNNDLASQHRVLLKYKKIRDYKSIRKSTVKNIIEITKDLEPIEQSLSLNDLLNRHQSKRKTLGCSHPFERKSFKAENPVFSLPDNEHFDKLNFYCNAHYLTKLNAFVEELSRLNILKTRKYVDSYYSLKELNLLLKESNDNYIQNNIREMISDLEKETEKENLLIDQQFRENIRYYSQIETRHGINNIKEIAKINVKMLDNIAKII